MYVFANLHNYPQYDKYDAYIILDHEILNLGCVVLNELKKLSCFLNVVAGNELEPYHRILSLNKVLEIVLLMFCACYIPVVRSYMHFDASNVNM